MTMLSRALLRKLIIQEMRKPPLSSGLTFDDTIEIDRDTDIEEFPEVEYGDFGDYDDDDDYDDDPIMMFNLDDEIFLDLIFWRM